MNAEQLLEVTKGMKDEILNLLVNTNLVNDKTAKRTIKSINNMFDELNVTIDDVIPEEVLGYYFTGSEEAKKELAKFGLQVSGVATGVSKAKKVSDMLSSHVHMEAIGEITDNLMLDLKSAIRTSKENVNVSIKETLSTFKGELKSGIISGNPRKEITKRVAKAFEENGMTSFTTIDGKKLPLDFYSEVTVRTNLKKANLKGAGNRYIENGVDTYRVTGNTPTCHICYSLRGIVFTSNPNNKDYTYKTHEDVISHPNCQCGFIPIVVEYKTEEELEKFKKESKNFDPDKDSRSKIQKENYKKDQDKNRKRNEEKKQYARYKSILEDDEVPKTLGGFRRMKTANSENYKKLLSNYRSTNRNVNKVP